MKTFTDSLPVETPYCPPFPSTLTAEELLDINDSSRKVFVAVAGFNGRHVPGQKATILAKDANGTDIPFASFVCVAGGIAGSTQAIFQYIGNPFC